MASSSGSDLVGLLDYLETKIGILDKKIDESLMMNKGKEVQIYNENHKEEDERVDGFWSDILNMLDQDSSSSEQPSSFPFEYGVGNPSCTSSVNGGGENRMDFGSESWMMKGKEIQHYNEDHEEERLDGFWSDMLLNLDQECEQPSFPFGYGFGLICLFDELGAVEADFGHSNCCWEYSVKSGWFEEQSCFCDPYFGYSSNELDLEYKMEASPKRQKLEHKTDFVF